MSSTTRSHVRHAGDDAEFYVEQDRRKAERRAELEARIAEREAADPAFAAASKRRRR